MEPVLPSQPLVAIPVTEPLTAAPVSELIETSPPRRFFTLLRIVPWTTSMLLHMALVLALGLCMVALPQRRDVPFLAASIVAATPTPPQLARLAGQEPKLSASAGPTARPATSDSKQANLPLAQPSPPSRSNAQQPARVPIATQAEAPQYTSVRELIDVVDKEAAVPTPSGRPQRERSSPSSGGIVPVAGTSDAAESVLGSIRREYKSGDLLVVWLLDASLSLYEDRQIVASKLDPFYREIQAQQGQPHVLMSAAVAFGATVKELQSPTRYGVKLVKSTSQEVPIDATGIENVLSAIEWCVAKYRKAWKEPIQIVVWTDESGDDILRLEETIAYCRRQGVFVTVVGPTAVFGTERGLQPYIDRPTGYRFMLPVKRGPDTSLPERVSLPYWHESSLPAPSVQGAQVDTGLPWFGGAYREGVLSGVGPYALTRLALETGGQFLRLDRPNEYVPFAFEQMQNYLPDYGSPAEYLRQVQYRPLRQAILASVQLTAREHAVLTPPRMAYVSYRDEFYPFTIYEDYVNATRFRIDLKDQFAIEATLLQAGNAVVEQCLATFGPDGMEAEYEREDSLRWKAWYDLTRGRLLATSVRQLEYLLACRLILDRASFLNPETNHIRFVPTDRLLSTDPNVKRRIDEATRLLKRCVANNPGTPWAMLAQWELDRAPGIDVQQVVIPPPQPRTPVPVGAAPAPVPKLPNF